MLVNWEKNYLFVHLPKTGGTSITQLLKHDCDRVWLPLRLIGYLFDHSGHTLPDRLFPIVGYPYHITAKDLRQLWGKERFDELTSFAFIRNPWDLVVSEYFYIQKKWDHPHKHTVRSLGSFTAYVRWKQNTGYHRQQCNWLYADDGTMLVKHLGRFETYEQDATEILRLIGRAEDIPHHNATERKSYQNYYTDELIQAVAEMYATDIDRFGYTY